MTHSSNGSSTPQEPPSPQPADNARQADRRFLFTLLIWLAICAFLGATLLVFAIWVDWRGPE